MKIENLFAEIEKLGMDFYTGVPDSQLRALCDSLMDKYGVGEHHVIAANEGAAVGLAAGHLSGNRQTGSRIYAEQRNRKCGKSNLLTGQ